jgi:hypothetical protein
MAKPRRASRWTRHKWSSVAQGDTLALGALLRGLLSGIAASHAALRAASGKRDDALR